jgi:hypothetical protein
VALIVEDGAMNNLERQIRNLNHEPDDVRVLKGRIPLLDNVAPETVARLYEIWSEYAYSARWFILNDDGIQEFADWLAQEW